MFNSSAAPSHALGSELFLFRRYGFQPLDGRKQAQKPLTCRTSIWGLQTASIGQAPSVGWPVEKRLWLRQLCEPVAVSFSPQLQKSSGNISSDGQDAREELQRNQRQSPPDLVGLLRQRIFVFSLIPEMPTMTKTKMKYSALSPGAFCRWSFFGQWCCDRAVPTLWVFLEYSRYLHPAGRLAKAPVFRFQKDFLQGPSMLVVSGDSCRYNGWLWHLSVTRENIICEAT